MNIAKIASKFQSLPDSAKITANKSNSADNALYKAKIASELKQNKINSMEDMLKYSGYFAKSKLITEDKFMYSRIKSPNEQFASYAKKLKS